ncbi:MAG: hypothetical protein WAX89_02775 [Alphaproteobacteria bacterium]
MGSLFSTKTPAPPPPPPPTYIRDEINRVEQVPQTNADGTVTYVTRQIPLTAEEQKKKDELNSIMQTALAEIQKLSASDYADDDTTKGVLDAWQKERERVLADTGAQRQTEEEKMLARRGLADSTAAQAIRRQRQLDSQTATSRLRDERTALGQDIRQQKIGLQQNLYGIAASQTDATAARQQQAAIQGQSALVSTNTARQASLVDYYNMQNQRAQNNGSLFANAALTGVGMVTGSPMTTMGGLFGLFKR